jgi:hypothetical protein
MQAIEEVDRNEVIAECGFDGGRQSYQTAKDATAVNFPPGRWAS